MMNRSGSRTMVGMGGELGWMPPQPEADGAKARNAWLVTFTDLVALLLAFFVMLFAMMTLDQRVWDQMRDGFTTQWVTPDPLAVRHLPDEPRDAPTVQLDRGIDLDYLSAVLERELAKHRALDGARVERQQGRLLVTIPNRMLFEVGDTQPIAASAEALHALGGLLENISNRLEVIGHADPRPLPEADRRSNWELSLARSIAVADMLARAGYTQPILVRGHGQSRFNELSGEAEEARLTLSRRTDIVILDDKGELPR